MLPTLLRGHPRRHQPASHPAEAGTALRKRPLPSVEAIEQEAQRYRREMRKWQDKARYWEREYYALAEAVNIRATIVRDMSVGTTAGYEFWTYALSVAEVVANGPTSS